MSGFGSSGREEDDGNRVRGLECHDEDGWFADG